MNQRAKALLEELVSTPSVFPQEHAVSSLLEGKLKNLGLKVRTLPCGEGRNNLVAWSGEHPHYLGLYAHMDTVPPAYDYNRDPFTLEWDGHLGRGLGAADMKGGLACILLAAEIVAQESLPVKIILAVDEENISLGANTLATCSLLQDVDFLISAEGAQVMDPPEPFTAVIARKGRIVIDVTIRGKAAHAAEPEQGRSAVEDAALFISALSQISFPEHPKLGATRLLVEAIHSEAQSYSVPELCELRISALTSPGTTSASCLDAIQKLGNSLGLDLSSKLHPRETPYSESYEIDAKDEFFKLLHTEVLQPHKITLQYSGSVADENVFARVLGVPILCIGANGAGMHQASEWIDLNSMLNLIEVYKKCMRLYASHKC